MRVIGLKANFLGPKTNGVIEGCSKSQGLSNECGRCWKASGFRYLTRKYLAYPINDYHTRKSHTLQQRAHRTRPECYGKLQVWLNADEDARAFCIPARIQ